MPTPSRIARLTDIIEAVELIRNELAGATLQSFESAATRKSRGRRSRGLAMCCAMSTSELPTMCCGESCMTTYRPWRRSAARSWRGSKPPNGKGPKQDVPVSLRVVGAPEGEGIG